MPSSSISFLLKRKEHFSCSTVQRFPNSLPLRVRYAHGGKPSSSASLLFQVQPHRLPFLVPPIVFLRLLILFFTSSFINLIFIFLHPRAPPLPFPPLELLHPK